MKILALDPGASFGWCVIDGNMISSGVWDLNKGLRESNVGMRLLRLDHLLVAKILAIIDVVYYEEVRGHRGVQAAHAYGAYEGKIQEVCARLDTAFESVPIGTWKKAALGRGNVNEAGYLAAAQERWPDAEIVKSDEAAARFIAVTRPRIEIEEIAR